MVVEGALEGELDDHLGYGKHDPAGRNGGNSRNGYRAKTVLTDTGPVEISVPRDRDASFRAENHRQEAAAADWCRRAGDLLVGERADARGDRRAPGRGLRRRGIQADGHHDHRPGDGGNGGLAVPPARPGLCRAVHRRHQREDPRGPGRQPAGLPGAGRHRRRRAGRARPVGRGARRRRGRQVLAPGPDRDQEPRRAGRVHAGLRRAEGPARRGRRSVGEDHRPDLHRSPAPELIQVRVEEGLGPRSPKTSSPSTPRRPRPRHWTGSPSSPASGRNATRRSSGSGRTRGRSSCRSCSSTGK